MPRQQRIIYKYKCKELLCSNIVRQDKWQAHCKKNHAFKFRRGEEIQKEIISYKEIGDSEWQSYKQGNVSTTDKPNTSAGRPTLAEEEVAGDPNISTASPKASTSVDDPPEYCVDVQDSADEQSEKSVTDDDDSESEEDEEITSTENKDPALLCGKKLNSQEINNVLQQGVCQPGVKYDYPETNGRHFNCELFERVMPDKSKQHRKWITYSKSLDKVFCLPCMLFSGPLGSDTWTRTGFCLWQNAQRDINRHESTDEHKKSEISRIQWQCGNRIDYLSSKHKNVLVEENRKVIECAIDCAKYLATEMIAFRGKLSDTGKFINLFRLIAKRDPSAASYLEKIKDSKTKKKKMSVNLISPRNIRIIVNTMKQMVVSQIIDNVREIKKSSLIFDGTVDCSKKDVSVLLVRYLEKDESDIPKPVERLVEVFTSGDTSGCVLKDRVLEALDGMSFEKPWIVGQCYDGAGNMQGKYKGMATLIQNECSQALYVWCHAHRLNLVLNSVASCCPDVRNTLGLLEELYVFMSGHKRNDVFQKSQEGEKHKQQLKRVSTTRWNSYQASVETVLSCFKHIISTLEDLKTSTDSATITGAIGLSKRLGDYRTILTMILLKKIYGKTGAASRTLQSVAIDLSIASSLLQDCKKKFALMREQADEIWQEILDEGSQFATLHSVEPNFPTETLRRKKRRADELASDEALVGENRFKVDVFIRVLDEVTQQLESRFDDHSLSLMTEMSVFAPKSLLGGKTITATDIVGICRNYGLNEDHVAKELTDFREAYKVCAVQTQLDDDEPVINPEEEEFDEIGNDEIDDFSETDKKMQWQENSFMKPLLLVTELSSYPNLVVIYSILTTLAVSSASAERALSKLRIVKNRLRSIMADDLLSSLLILASEKDIVNNLNIDQIINKIATASPSLQKSLSYF